MKKVLISLITSLMIFSVVNTNVVNAEEETTNNGIKQFDQYMAFGDSISRGLTGEPGQEDHDAIAYDFKYRNVKGSYPYLVAQAVGCSNPQDLFENGIENSKYFPVCFMGESVTQMLDLLGVERSQEEKTKDYMYDRIMMGTYYNYAKYLFGSSGTQGSVANILGSDENKDKNTLITTCLGLGDVGIKSMTDLIMSLIETDEGSYKLKENINTEELIKTLLESVSSRYKQWTSDYDKFIKTIKSYNDKATIIVVGYFNPFKNVKISQDQVIPFGDLINPTIKLMNAQAKQIAKKNGCIFVDVSSAESVATSRDWSMSDFSSNAEIANYITGLTHPTYDSFKYICNQITAAIPAEDAEIDENCKIVLDLVRTNFFKIVNYITVNGLPIDVYTLEDNIITIPYNNPFAKIAQVSLVDKEGKTVSKTFELTYKNGKYEAICIETTNDVEKEQKLIISKVGEFFKSIREATKNFIISKIKPNKQVKDNNQEELMNIMSENAENIQEFIEENEKSPEEIKENIEEVKENLGNAYNEYNENKEEYYKQAKENMEKIHEQTTESIKKTVEIGQEVTKDIVEQSVENFKKLGEDIKEHIENSPLPKPIFPQFPINH